MEGGRKEMKGERRWREGEGDEGREKEMEGRRKR